MQDSGKNVEPYRTSQSKNFSWLFILGKRQTRNRLARYINNMPTSCPMCNLENESISHLFVDCSFAKLFKNESKP